MKSITLFCLAFTALFVSVTASAQIVRSHYFYDTIGGGLNYIHDHIQQEDGIIISGFKGDPGNNIPVILKIDRSGEVLWSTEGIDDPAPADNYRFDMSLFADGFIYGVSTEHLWPDYESTLWKVNAQTGEVVFTVPYDADQRYPVWRDYDDTTFYMMHGSTIRRIAKSDGSILQENTFSSVPAAVSFNMEVDRNGNVYILRYNRLTKYNGNNFEQPIWSRTYDEFDVTELHRIYLDEYGEVFLFGRNGSSAGVGMVMKIQKQSGLKLWVCKVEDNSDTDMSERDVRIADFKDISGRIYATYQHVYVGGSPKKFVTAKINKTNGHLDWLSLKGIDNTGYTAGGQGRAALSLDVDCSGNIYQTGYYASANYQPGKWGSMKLNGTNGTKVYEFTVSQDTSANEKYSVGLGAFSYGDNPLFIGHEQIQDESSKVRPLLVKVNPSNGTILMKKPIGNPQNGFASTLKALTQDNVLYFLKQTGTAVTVEARNQQYGLLWSYALINDSVATYGGQMTLTANSVVFTAVQQDPNGGSKLFVTKLNRSTGAFTMQNSRHSDQPDFTPFELEADEQEAYVFAKNSDSLFYSKVSSSEFTPWAYLDAAAGFNGYEGEINIVLNKDAGSLLVIGAEGMISIAKSSMQKSSLGAHTEPADYYSFSQLNDLVVLSGKTAAQEQILTAKNLSDWTTAWTETYAANGMIAKTVFGAANDLYFIGTENGNINVQRVSLNNGASAWSYSTSAALYPDARAMDVAYNSEDDYLALAGFHTSGSYTHAMIQLLTASGDTIYTWKGTDDLTGKSRTNTLVNMAGTRIGAGGAWNRSVTSEEGFVFFLDSTSNVNLGVQNIKGGPECTIYPNPAVNKVSVKGLQGLYSYTIAGVSGNLVQSRKNVSEYEIDLNSLASGTYHLYLENGGQTFFFLLVVL